MKKSFLLLPIFLITAFFSYAQELKKSCDPSACGPNNTKVEEAAVISDLRNDITTTKSTFRNKGLIEGKEIVTKGDSEEKSLEIMVEEINALELAKGRESTDFSSLSGARLVKKLQEVLQSLN